MDNGMFMQLGKITGVCFNNQNYEDEVELVLGEDYKIVEKNGKLYAKNIGMSRFPKEYDGCIESMGNNFARHLANPREKYNGELGALNTLLLCRDAYWKIDDGYNPDWTQGDIKHCIAYICGAWQVCQRVSESHLFAFSSEEIAVRFYTSFEKFFKQIENIINIAR